MVLKTALMVLSVARRAQCRALLGSLSHFIANIERHGAGGGPRLAGGNQSRGQSQQRAGGGQGLDVGGRRRQALAIGGKGVACERPAWPAP